MNTSALVCSRDAGLVKHWAKGLAAAIALSGLVLTPAWADSSSSRFDDDDRGYSPESFNRGLHNAGYPDKKHKGDKQRHGRNRHKPKTYAKVVHAEPINVKQIIDKAMPYLSPNLPGEAILTVGSALAEVASHTCGVIAVGPFGCMPNRLSEAILSETMNSEGKPKASSNGNGDSNWRLRAVLGGLDDLPFLAIESDGSPFPQVIGAKLEAFCLQAERLHERMQKVR